MAGAVFVASCGKDDDPEPQDNNVPGQEQPDDQDDTNNPAPEKKKVTHWDKPIFKLNENGDTLTKWYYDGDVVVEEYFKDGSVNEVRRNTYQSGLLVKIESAEGRGKEFSVMVESEYDEKGNLIKYSYFGYSEPSVNEFAIDGCKMTYKLDKFVRNWDLRFWSSAAPLDDWNQNNFWPTYVDITFRSDNPHNNMLEAGYEYLDDVVTLVGTAEDGSEIIRWECEYDAAGRVTSRKKYALGASYPHLVHTYEYDGLTIMRTDTRYDVAEAYSDEQIAEWFDGDFGEPRLSSSGTYYYTYCDESMTNVAERGYINDGVKEVAYVFTYDDQNRELSFKSSNGESFYTYTYGEDFVVFEGQNEYEKDNGTTYYLVTEE